ncbi:MAG: hypothetical protein ACLQMO_10120 [Acidobacteriaceae bacterium]
MRFPSQLAAGGGFRCGERRVERAEAVERDRETERFYRALEAPALVGVEACGNSQRFMNLLERLGPQVWVGDAAQIRATPLDAAQQHAISGDRPHREQPAGAPGRLMPDR